MSGLRVAGYELRVTRESLVFFCSQLVIRNRQLERYMAEQKATNVTWHEGTVSREERQQLLNQKGVTVWMTGLSASGKSTIACILEQMLLHKKKQAYRLDGDNIRMGLNKNLGFSAEDRAENIRRIGEVAKLFTDAGVIAITSFISPYKKDRDAVRASSKPGEFVEVYVHVSLAEAEKRDPKGLYKKARAGQLKGFTGIDDPYEAPDKPEILIETEKAKPDVAAQLILDYLEKHGYLKS
jgi:adenylylsulfate kinase